MRSLVSELARPSLFRTHYLGHYLVAGEFKVQSKWLLRLELTQGNPMLASESQIALEDILYPSNFICLLCHRKV